MDFFGKNGLPARMNFLQRKNYIEQIEEIEIEFIDLWYENPNYGLYNKNFEPAILLAEDAGSTTSIFGDYAAPSVIAASFVVSAFNDFRDFYIEKTQKSSISFPPFIEGLVPKKAYIDFQDSYTDYIRELSDRLLGTVVASKSDVFDFEDFMDISRRSLFPALKSSPITKSGFLLSDSCPIGVSGLCIELANQPYDSDLEKGRFLQTLEFKCYADIANGFGFYVDKNVPWRLIANLESPAMKSYISRYHGGTNTENILNRFFRAKTHYDDLEDVQRFFLGVYNQFIDQNPLFTKVEVDPTSIVRTKSNMLRPSPDGVYGRSEWLSLLLEIRHAELGIQITQEEFTERRQKVLDLQNNYGLSYNRNGYSLKPALGKIGLYSSEHIRSIYENKENFDSSKRTTLKDYM